MLAFLMLGSVLSASAVLVATMSLQTVLLAQTKPGPPQGGRATFHPFSTNFPASQPNFTTTLQPSSTDNKPPNSKFGQGTLYFPEINVPREPLNEYHKGLDAMKKRDIGSAEQHLLRATELYPKFSAAYNALGVAYEQDPAELNKVTGKNVAAKNAFHQSLSLNPNNDLALTNMGHLLLGENDTAEAERVLRTAIAIQPGSTITCAELMRAQAIQQHYDQVLVTGQRVQHGEANKFPIIYFLRAVAWDHKSDRPQATRDYHEFLKRSPHAREASIARTALERLTQNQIQGNITELSAK